QRAHTIVIVPLRDHHLGAEVVSGLADALEAMGRTRKVSQEGLNLLQLDALESEFEFIVLETDASDSERTHLAFRQADQVVFVAAEDEPKDLSEVECGLAREAGFLMKRKHLALCHKADADGPGDMPTWQRGRDIERVYPLRAGRQRDYARLARFLTSSAV